MGDRRSRLLLVACLSLACGDDGGTTETTSGSASSTGTGSSSTGSSSTASTSTAATDGTDTAGAIACAEATDAASCAAANEGRPFDGPQCMWLSLSRVTDGACTVEAAGEGCFQVNLDEGGAGCDPQFRTNDDLSVDFFSPADCALILEPGWKSCGFGNDSPPPECSCFP
ncbi:MAG: hypothetical protein KC486_10480 [Myxococcales bacterium]|nr:hypothetical protein [Myxococcales bacterium]